MPRPYFQVVLAITLIIAVSYYWTPGFEPSPEVSAWQQTLPQTYLVNPRFATYNEEGTLRDVLQADTATYYSSRKESVIKSPRLYSHDRHDETWSASAENGHYQHSREILTLTENVLLSNDINQVQLATAQMKIDLRRNVATSQVPVTVTHGESSTRADGMVADLDAQIVRLQPNVESVYVP